MPNKNTKKKEISPKAKIIKKEDNSNPIIIIKKSGQITNDWVSKEFRPPKEKSTEQPDKNEGEDNIEDPKAWIDSYAFANFA